MAKRTPASAEKERSAEGIRLQHVPAQDFRFIYADGLLYKFDKEKITMTFYSEEQIVQSEVGELTEPEEPGKNTYKLSIESELNLRVHHATIRLPIESLVRFISGAVKQLEQIQNPSPSSTGSTSATAQKVRQPKRSKR